MAPYDLFVTVLLVVGLFATLFLSLLMAYAVFEISQKLKIGSAWLWATGSMFTPLVLVVWLLVVKKKLA